MFYYLGDIFYRDFALVIMNIGMRLGNDLLARRALTAMAYLLRAKNPREQKRAKIVFDFVIVGDYKITMG